MTSNLAECSIRVTAQSEHLSLALNICSWVLLLNSLVFTEISFYYTARAFYDNYRQFSVYYSKTVGV